MSEHTYTIVLTHDVDHLSLRRVPFFSRATGSYFKRCLVSNLFRLLRGDMGAGTYCRSVVSGLSLPLVKARVLPDPMEISIKRILKIEEEYGVRSTFYFLPFCRVAGFIRPGEPAPVHRGAWYDVTDYRELLEYLDRNGWEVGVHGINAHMGVEDAAKELGVFKGMLPHREKWGMRMHWLFTSGSLYRDLHEAGYYYDTTYGANDVAGFLDGCYYPFIREGMWVLPLNIQDGTLLAHWHRSLGSKEAWADVKNILKEAREQRAVVTVLWHNASFVAPRYWERLYRGIIEQGQRDNARFLTAMEIIDEYAKEFQKAPGGSELSGTF